MSHVQVKLPEDDKNVETYRSICYIKINYCDINCAFVGCNKNNMLYCSVVYISLSVSA